MKLAFDNKKALMIASSNNETAGMMSRLRTQGLSIEHISSGFQAISMIENEVKNKTFKSDVIILFESCSDMPQREALNLIRVLLDSSKVPVVVFSKDTHIEEIQELIMEGASDFLANYNDFNVVIEKIKKVLT